MANGEQLPVEIQIELPPENEVGVPADFAAIWHTPTAFVLDFAVTKQPPQAIDDGSGTRRAVLPARVVSRVRLPPEQIFEIARALTQQLDMWEVETGRRPPVDPDLPS